jgi:carboxyl-terminal processing protease
MKFLSILTAICTFSVAYSQYTDTSKLSTSHKFAEVLTFIEKMYVDDVNSKQLTDAAIVGMLEKLDPHSVYISKEDVDDANEKINGSFVGIGIRYQMFKDTLNVVATIPGGPSAKLGILPGDKITMVDGKSIAGIGIKTAGVREKLMGDPGTKVKVQVIRRKNSTPLDFNITRDHIPVHSVECHYMVTSKIGYIKLNTFARQSKDEVRQALRNLKKQGMESLVFDLQDNGGGLLSTARELADEFLSGKKLIVYSEGKAQPRQDLNAKDAGNFEEGKLIMLIDENSASASEILTGAIQDWDRGVLIGRRTYGKGLVQRPIPLNDGSQIRLTIARYFTPTGRFIQKPYTDKEAYKNDYKTRYESGELTSADSVKFVDSLKYKTLVTGRTVYGGGGIMPDIFVPIDTSKVTPSLRTLVRGGHFNNFALTFVNEKRDELMLQFPDFESFKTKFMVDDKMYIDFLNFAKKEEKDIALDEKELLLSKDNIKLRILGNIATDLWTAEMAYQILNKDNPSLKRAIKFIENGEYENANIQK